MLSNKSALCKSQKLSYRQKRARFLNDLIKLEPNKLSIGAIIHLLQDSEMQYEELKSIKLNFGFRNQKWKEENFGIVMQPLLFPQILAATIANNI